MEVRHYQRFSDLIKAIRRKHRLSQRSLAKALKVSPGYVGQWELKVSQPSPEVAVKLCRTYNIKDIEYVQRLVFASRAPKWLQESIVRYEKNPEAAPELTVLERRVVHAVRRLPEADVELLAERIEGWVDATVEAEKERRRRR